MKKIFLPAIIIVLCNSAMAQKTGFGFTAGTSIANYHSKVDGESDDGNSKIGLTAGIFADVSLSDNFSFQPAVNFVQKGTKDEETSGGITEKIKLNTNCIEVPLNFIYTTKGSTGKFFIGGGPSIAFSVSGKWKYDDGTDSFTETVHFGNSDDDDLKGLDFGANILTGFQFNGGVFIALNYNQGISNLFPGGSSDGKLHSNYFGIKLGYLLKK